MVSHYSYIQCRDVPNIQNFSSHYSEESLEPLFPAIRHKFANVLNGWHPSDESAYKTLKPWLGVFSKGVMEAFLNRTIVPQLSYCLQLMPINPRNEDIQPFKWVLAWRDMISPGQYADILNKSFFGKWLQVSWL